jgi:hypothetical protein
MTVHRRKPIVKPIPLLVAALAVLPFLAPAPTEARSLGRMLQNSGLVPADLSVMEEAALQLVEPLGRTGDARRWSNPATRTVGAVTLGRIEGNCAELVHRVRTARMSDTATYRTWRCRTADGGWQVSAGPN